MKGRSSLYLLVAIIALGVFIWAQESWRSRNPAKTMQRVRLFNLDPQTLVSIEFSHSNGVTRCVKENGVWMAGDGAKNEGPADVALVQRMIAGLNSMGKGTTITEKQLDLRGFDSGAYGFESPTVTITAVDNQGERGWMIGRKSPLDNVVYVKSVDAETIYTISDKLLAIVPVAHDVLRDRTLFAGDAATARRLEIRGSAGFTQLVKEPQAGWRVQQPVSALADSKEVDDFLARLYGFRIHEFTQDDVSDFTAYGFQEDSQQISVGGADGSSSMIVIGGDTPDQTGFVYGRRADSSSVFTVSSEILKALNTPAKRFRDARVLTVPLATVSSVVVSRKDERLEMSVDPESKRWNIVKPVSWAADAKAVADLILMWGGAVVIEFDVATDVSDVEWAFEFGSAEAGMTNRIEVLPTNGRQDGLLVRLDDDPAVYQLNLPLVPGSAIDMLFFKNREIWNFREDEIARISVSSRDGARRSVARAEDGTFDLGNGGGSSAVDQARCSRWFRALEKVRTSGYIDYNPSDLSRYGLDAPAAELHLGLSSTNQLGRVLLIGDESPEGFYSMIKGRDVVFYLEPEVVGLLTADLNDREILTVPLDE